MNLLLDTHLLLWCAEGSSRLSEKARALIDTRDNALFFSAASLWEVIIKSGLGRSDFKVDARLLRRGLLDNGYTELPISGAHAIFVESLPPVHRDPFDRILVAQATLEGYTLLTADKALAQYPGPVQCV